MVQRYETLSRRTIRLSPNSYVLSTRGRLHPRFLREERLGEKGGTFLKGKEGRVGFRTQLLFHHIPEEQGITDDISAPHTLRLLD